MKKILVLFVIAATAVLTSCGNGANGSKESVDSTTVSVDSLSVDTTAVESVEGSPVIEGEKVETPKELVEEVK